jgi:chromosome segregation ATPase
MAADKSRQGGEDAADLAGEVKALRDLLQSLQAQISPAMQSSLRERSDELQRLGGELAEHKAEAERLQAALDAADSRALELEREAGRWRDAARRGLDELAERIRAAQARFEHQTSELNAALTAAREELRTRLADAETALEARQAEAVAAIEARDRAVGDAKRRERMVQTLKAKVVGRERRRIELERSVSWRISQPLYRLEAWLTLTKRRAARLKRKLFGG